MKLITLTKTIAALGACILVAGCQAGGRDSATFGPSPGPAPGPTSANDHGGFDAGGANGVNRRPLESFCKAGPFALKEVETSVLPMIENLKKSFMPLAADLTYILKERSWCMSPVRLDTIPSFKIGVYFPTEQYALQNFDEIWIDEQYFNSMAVDDRLTVIVHEMVMGVRLLAGAGRYDRCMAGATISALDGSKPETAQARRMDCINKYGIEKRLSSRSGNLTKEDYFNIRTLTLQLLKTKGVLDGEELKAWLKAMGIRVYDEP